LKVHTLEELVKNKVDIKPYFKEKKIILEKIKDFEDDFLFSSLMHTADIC
jgi:hypothetical protein